MGLIAVQRGDDAEGRFGDAPHYACGSVLLVVQLLDVEGRFYGLPEVRERNRQARNALMGMLVNQLRVLFSF